MMETVEEIFKGSMDREPVDVEKLWFSCSQSRIQDRMDDIDLSSYTLAGRMTLYDQGTANIRLE